MAPLAGLTGFDQASQVTDQGVLEAHGGPVDPSHGEYGDHLGDSWPSAFGTGYHGAQYGPVVDQGSWPDYNQPGRPLDRTPDTHSAPYPRGLIQPDLESPGSYAQAAQALQAQRTVLHGQDLGGPGVTTRRAPGGHETPVDITVDRYDAPNVNILSQVPGQLRQGNNGAGRDPDQGYGKLNDTPEFQAGHSIRIVQHDTLHFDRSLDYAPPQPFWGRVPIQQAGFDGPDSPYGQVLGDTSTGQQVVWEGRIGTPTAYAQPPEPAVNQAASQQQDVWAYGY